MLFKPRPLFAVLWMAALLLPGREAVAQSEDYLKELDSEASDLTLDRQTEDRGREGGDIRDAVRLTEVPVEEPLQFGSGLSREDFEKALKRNLMGSYLFYRRLSAERQNQIYNAYLENPDPEVLRQAIVQSMKQQRGAE